MNRVILLLATLAMLLLAACAARSPRPAPAGSEGAPAAILFVGNSYSFGVPAALRKHASRRGRALRVDQVTHGGWTLAKHAASDATMRKIREGGWDIVVLQEQSRIPSLPAIQRDALMTHPLHKLVHAAGEAGAEPVLYQTWGYRDGDPHRSGDDHQAMAARLREGYRAAAARQGDLRVVPVGDAWANEVAADRAKRLFQPDGSHPSPAGDALTAAVFYETLFGR